MTFLLQTRFNTRYVETADTATIITAAVIIGAIFLLLIVAGFITSRRARRSPSESSQKYKKGSFRRRARRIGLSKTQIRALETIIQRVKVRSPYGLLSNSRQLDIALRQSLNAIEESRVSNGAKESQKLILYGIKQTVERNANKPASLGSTKQLAPNQPIAISQGNGAQLSSRIVSVLRDGIAVEVPTDDAGNQLRWEKWAPLKVHFWRENGEGYSFDTKVTGYNTVRGVTSAFLQHSNSIQQATQRRYKRKGIESPCYFYPIKILTSGSGRNQTRRAFVDTKKGTLAKIVEVSVGGCSIRSPVTSEKGSLIRVDFETEKRVSVSTYGKVVDVRRDATYGYIMHIMFTRVSKEYMNRINSYIYEYDKRGVLS